MQRQSRDEGEVITDYLSSESQSAIKTDTVQ